MKRFIFMFLILSISIFGAGMTELVPINKAWNDYHIKDNERIESYMKHVEKDHKNGISSVSAISSIPFQNVEVGEYSIGAGIGSFKDSFSVGVGVLAKPMEDFNVKIATGVNANDVFDSTFSIGFSIKITNK